MFISSNGLQLRDIFTDIYLYLTKIVNIYLQKIIFIFNFCTMINLMFCNTLPILRNVGKMISDTLCTDSKSNINILL